MTSSTARGLWPKTLPGSRDKHSVGWMSQKQQALLTAGRLTMQCAIYLGFQHRCKHPEGSCSHLDLKKKKKAPSDPETDIFALLQMIIESKVHFSLQMPRTKAEPTRPTAVTLHDKCQIKTRTDVKDYMPLPLFSS